jgi:hypothetical protein
LMHDAAEVAEKNGMSVANWISSTVAERLRVERQTERFYRMRAAGTSGKTLLEILDKAPDREPNPGDEL